MFFKGCGDRSYYTAALVFEVDSTPGSHLYIPHLHNYHFLLFLCIISMYFYYTSVERRAISPSSGGSPGPV